MYNFAYNIKNLKFYYTALCLNSGCGLEKVNVQFGLLAPGRFDDGGGEFCGAE